MSTAVVEKGTRGISGFKLPFAMRIKLDIKSQDVYPASVVKGSVLYGSSIKGATKFAITLTGKVYTFMNVGPYNHFEEEHTFLTQSCDLLDVPYDSASKKGEYRFAFEIPVDAPPSVKVDACCIKYQLKTEIEFGKSWKSHSSVAFSRYETMTLNVHSATAIKSQELERQRHRLNVLVNPLEPTEPVENALSSEDDIGDLRMPPIDGRTYITYNSYVSDDQSEFDDTASTTKGGSIKGGYETQIHPLDERSENVYYRMFLDIWYPKTGVYTDEPLPISLHLFPTSPMPELVLTVARIGLIESTWYIVDGKEDIRKFDYVLFERSSKAGFRLPRKAMLDYSNFFEGVQLPDIPSTFSTKLMRRSYHLFVYLQFAHPGRKTPPSRFAVRIPLEVLGARSSLVNFTSL